MKFFAILGCLAALSFSALAEDAPNPLTLDASITVVVPGDKEPQLTQLEGGGLRLTYQVTGLHEGRPLVVITKKFDPPVAASKISADLTDLTERVWVRVLNEEGKVAYAIFEQSTSITVDLPQLVVKGTEDEFFTGSLKEFQLSVALKNEIGEHTVEITKMLVTP